VDLLLPVDVGEHRELRAVRGRRRREDVVELRSQPALARPVPLEQPEAVHLA